MQVVFIRGYGIGAWLVRAFTRSPYGHCAIKDGPWMTEAVVTGVHRVPWPGLIAIGEATTGVIVTVPGTTPEGEARAAQFLLEQVGKPYDWLGIVLDVLAEFIRLPRCITDETRKRWTCSRLDAFACALAEWQGPAWRVPATPGGLYDALTETR